jgi:hypothetical protein
MVGHAGPPQVSASMHRLWEATITSNKTSLKERIVPQPPRVRGTSRQKLLVLFLTKGLQRSEMRERLTPALSLQVVVDISGDLENEDAVAELGVVESEAKALGAGTALPGAAKERTVSFWPHIAIPASCKLRLSSQG